MPVKGHDTDLVGNYYCVAKTGWRGEKAHLLTHPTVTGIRKVDTAFMVVAYSPPLTPYPWRFSPPIRIHKSQPQLVQPLPPTQQVSVGPRLHLLTRIASASPSQWVQSQAQLLEVYLFLLRERWGSRSYSDRAGNLRNHTLVQWK